ncbi:MAG: Asp-tRNA(Asn)/Glu-tRNA(Gln) amidotransferase subunit GatB, partial [Euryarchaeota archaeon]|nr:Asp-tRNA(Asn)/Glu-tRNA(Gln) amidotransferase subunit GatB [Euryarchaeota archaeon]
KNFQITQYDTPIGKDGRVMMGGKEVMITRVHLEEDPGKVKRVGKAGEEVSLIDYNRSGIPLVEIVTAPDLASPEEAREFTSDLLLELRHLVGISDGDERNVRVDANVSVGEERVEIKNILGLRNLERGLASEVVRQTKMLKAGKAVVRETRRFDEERKVTLPSREKEFEEDYGYIAEPDLGVFRIGSMAASIVVPETPIRRASRMAGTYGIGLDAAKRIVLTSKTLADLFERLCSKLPPSEVVPWILGPLSSNWTLLEERLDEDLLERIEGIVGAVSEGTITKGEGRRKLAAMAKGEEVEDFGAQDGESELASLVAAYLDENPSIVSDFRANRRAANSVIGYVMRTTKRRFSAAEVLEVVNREMQRRL